MIPTTTPGFQNLAAFELAQRAAKLLANSTLVPKEYQNNIPNCVIALNMANRMGADPLMVMQNLYIVHGRPGWSSQFLIATFNQNDKFGALRYEFVGAPGTDEWGCRAWSYEKLTGEKLVGSIVTIGLAKKEGWYSKTGSKWQTMPEQMLMYRAASFFIRAYAPEIAMGLHTAEELVDTIDITPTTVDGKPYEAPVIENVTPRDVVKHEEVTPEGAAEKELNEMEVNCGAFNGSETGADQTVAEPGDAQADKKESPKGDDKADKKAKKNQELFENK